MTIIEFVRKREAAGKIVQGQLADFIIVQPIVFQG